MTEGRIDLFAESIDQCLRCRGRRRWIICTPWLAIPFLWNRAKRTAAAMHEIKTIERLARRGDIGAFCMAIRLPLERWASDIELTPPPGA